MSTFLCRLVLVSSCMLLQFHFEGMNFQEFIRSNIFLQGHKGKKQGPVKKPAKEDFLKQLDTCVNYFGKRKVQQVETEVKPEVVVAPKRPEEFNEQAILASMPRTTRENELRQQKRMVLLEKSIYMLTRDSEELRRVNKELYEDCKRQKREIKEHQVRKAKFDEERTQQEKKVELLRKLNGDNDELIKQLKPFVSITLDETDRLALSRARKQLTH